MYFFQGNVFWCWRDESKFPGQFLIGVYIFPKILCKTGLEPRQVGCTPCRQGAATVKVTVESDSDEEEDEEVVVGMEQRSACLLDKGYTGNLQVSYA